MDLAGAPEGPLHELSVQVAEAAEALVDAWTKASHAASPRLSALQWEALMIVRHKPGINLTRMAVEIGAAPPAVSRLCDRLEAAGLLRREPGRASRREIGLVLTVAGDDLIGALLARRYARFGEVLSRMPSAERTGLLSGLQAFTDAAQPAAPDSAEE
ncbi:MarR family winged helix-turn-helix transcriptional regulator [Streptomyces sp. NPDC015346]|uniref:MarR family winged helix-turn-helix transcriptional regulator n=1 Tax=Streptomyces sp. NPDC015346 TaxID=3364954 RepID=UPI0037001A40